MGGSCKPLKCMLPPYCQAARARGWVQGGELVDMYARGDITSLARANSYARLQWEDLTVGQALGLAAPHQPPWPPQSPAPSSTVTPLLPAPLGAKKQMLRLMAMPGRPPPTPLAPPNPCTPLHGNTLFGFAPWS